MIPPLRNINRASALLVAVALSAGLSAKVSWAQKQGQPDHERKILTKVDPVYPDLAKRMHLGGVVKGGHGSRQWECEVDESRRRESSTD